MSSARLITNYDPPPSAAATDASVECKLRLGLVQERWHADPAGHQAKLADGIRLAAAEGAEIVCLQELTLSPYFATSAEGPAALGLEPESTETGPTRRFASEMAAETGTSVHASLYERSEEAGELGFNTAIVVGPGRELLARTRKLHIPITAGYYEDAYFAPGPADGDASLPVTRIGPAKFAFPTCWDQWFPELARAYSLRGAQVLVYPTAIGSEPDHPDFDTEPLWETVIRANGISNGTFMVAVNRVGNEGMLRFYGSSFISDPYGRMLVQAPRDEAAVLVADLQLGQREDWLSLFPFLTTRRPEIYGDLSSPVIRD